MGRHGFTAAAGGGIVAAVLLLLCAVSGTSAAFDASDQTIMRFNCKMALLWSPAAGGRFAFADNATRYYTACSFEDHMWHHAYVAIDDAGVGQLYVDGTAMSLEVPKDPDNYAAGFEPAPLGDRFRTDMFPTFCPLGIAAHVAKATAAPAGKRRSLLEGAAAAGGGGAAGVADGDAGLVRGEGGGGDDGGGGRGRGLLDVGDDAFSGGGNHLTTDTWGVGPAATILPRHHQQRGRGRRRGLLTLPDDSDVPLTTGYKYEANYTADFKGTAMVYSDPRLSFACCKFSIGYQCAGGTGAEYEGPIRSANFVGLIDETTVWNRPLKSSEVEYALFKMPQGIAAREMRADHGIQLDITMGQIHYGRFNNPCKEGPKYNVSGSPEHASDVRDYSAFTAGFVDAATGRPAATDDTNDVVLLNSNYYTDAYPWHVRYVYTGVPWAAPLVSGIAGGDAVSIDGGATVTFVGVGFAPSPFLKCALAQTDPNDGLGGGGQPQAAAPAKGAYRHYYGGKTAPDGAVHVQERAPHGAGARPGGVQDGGSRGVRQGHVGAAGGGEQRLDGGVGPAPPQPGRGAGRCVDRRHLHP